VDQLFAPTDFAWQPVSGALARLRRTVLVVSGAALAAVAVALGVLLDVPTWWSAVAVVVVLAAAVAGWVLVGRNVGSWGYAEREDELLVKHGALFRTLVVVPYGRMQYVDVQAGPLEQVFRIASVHLHTASPGTSARIPGLPAAEAARLRDRLTSLGESQAAGL
jgi:hypothetical protein